MGRVESRKQSRAKRESFQFSQFLLSAFPLGFLSADAGLVKWDFHGKIRNQKAVRAKRESFQFSQFLLSAFPLVRLIMVVKIAINSEDSCSKSRVSFGSIAHSSRSSSSQRADDVPETDGFGAHVCADLD